MQADVGALTSLSGANRLERRAVVKRARARSSRSGQAPVYQDERGGRKAVRAAEALTCWDRDDDGQVEASAAVERSCRQKPAGQARPRQVEPRRCMGVERLEEAGHPGRQTKGWEDLLASVSTTPCFERDIQGGRSVFRQGGATAAAAAAVDAG
jgi:hypothetical protein